MSEPVGARGLSARLRSELDFELVEATPIDPGVVHNNRLFELRGADGRGLVVKLYYRDARRRLDREFGAFTALRRLGLRCVPTAHFKDDEQQYAVYSLEPGRGRAAAELTLEQVAAIGRLAAELHRVSPDDLGVDLPPPFGDGSLAEKIDFRRRQLATCLAAAARPDAFEPLRAICAEIDFSTVVEGLFAGLTAGMSAADLAATAPPRWRRLNPADFAPHNILFRPDDTLCAIDFEFCGLDDPVALPADFLSAEQSRGLTPAHERQFTCSYLAECGLPEVAFERLDRARAVGELGWLLTNLSLMTPDHAARKRFAGDFDLDAHLAERAANVRRRLERAVEMVAALR